MFRLSTFFVFSEFEFGCSKTSVVADIAKGDHIDHPDAYPCGIINRGSNEAYILATCNVTHPDNWIRGLQVSEWERERERERKQKERKRKTHTQIHRYKERRGGAKMHRQTDRQRKKEGRERWRDREGVEREREGRGRGRSTA